MTMPRSQPRPPLVAMLVSPEGASDGRVRREALALVRAGFDVTMLTAGEGTSRAESRFGAVRVIRLAVPRTMGDARRDRLARRRAWVPPIGPRDRRSERAARARLQADRLAAASTRAPVVVAAVLSLRAQMLGARTFAQRAVAKAVRVGWQGVDVLEERVPTGSIVSRRVESDDLEAVFGPALDQLGADALYVHGVGLVGVVARASARARLAGRRTPWVYDVDADLAGGPAEGAGARRDQAAGRALEKDYVRYAGGVVAANGSLADALQRRCRLSRRPSVVTSEDVATIADLYVELLGAEQLEPRPEEPGDDVRELPATQSRPTGDGRVVGIGPANMAGQGWAWAKALERELPGTRTEVLMVDRGSPLIFPADELVTTATYGRDVQWQESTRDRILSTWTHALIEAGRPLMGVLNGRTFAADAALMEQAGVKVALVFHGSELRDPRRHAGAHRWSPFLDTADEWVQRVQATVDMLRPDIEAFSGPALVSTPDLLEDLPRATWLPVVVDCEVWKPRAERPERAVPVVLHTPSRAAIKGSAFVDDALAPLEAEGLVEYRRVEGVAPERMPDVLGDADIVLDQFAIASYGVLACQAMASGTAVIGHVSAEVRAAVERATGQVLPIIEATPDTLEATLRRLLATPELRRAAAQAGPAFVRAVHDGKRSARILAEVLEMEPEAGTDPVPTPGLGVAGPGVAGPGVAGDERSGPDLPEPISD